MSFVVDNIELITPEVSYPDVDSDLAEHPITHYDRDPIVTGKQIGRAHV